MTWTQVFVFVSTLFISPCFMLHAGGVKGFVYADDGTPLAYATIYVKQTQSGTVTNQQGYYEILLPEGDYEISFQYLGYETQVRSISIANGFIALDITLRTQATMLQTVTVKADEEDPAYGIMRKTIAKANYHRQQIDQYTARVYIKGAGKLKDYPWLAKKALEKEGVEKNRVYIMESVSDVKYARPNKFEEKVISIHSDGKDNNTSPNQYIFGSFYDPEVAQMVSPLSPKAFSYYRYEYLGTFKDRDFEVSRIKVIPRTKGDDVIDGVFNIVEGKWNIHSFDVHARRLGADIYINVMYAPIEKDAWLPVSHRFNVDGHVLGFDFEYNYMATVSNYKVVLNPELYVERMEVIDETTQKEEAKAIQQKKPGTAPSANKKTGQLQERLAAGQEITRKELKSIVKEYEKQERQQLAEPEILSDVVFKIDSNAYRKDSVYWNLIRPVPLNQDEIKGYKKTDSLSLLERKHAQGDTLKKSKHMGFQPWDLLIGDSYSVSKHSHFKIHNVLGGFNTVEGAYLTQQLTFGTIVQDTNRTRISISPTFRYAFSRKTWSGNLAFIINNKKFRLSLEGGRYIRQLNRDEPILPMVNTLTTLLLEENFMKIYERDYVDVLYRRRVNPYLTWQISSTWEKRYELENQSGYKLVDRKTIEGYTSNRPINNELGNTGFPVHVAWISELGLVAQPWLKYKRRNGHKSVVPGSSPLFTLNYRQGVNAALNSSVHFSHLEVGAKHTFRMGMKNHLDVNLKGGWFPIHDSLSFIDHKHFMGNLTPFVTSDPVTSFRLMDYYAFSTSDKYITASINYQFRKLLVSSITWVRLAGIRENIFFNFLATPASGGYWEAGYSIDNIFNVLRLEVAWAFNQSQFSHYGFRIGIATNIAQNFSD